MTQLSKYQWLGSITLFVYLALMGIVITSDTSAQSSTWTVQSLKDYVDMRFDAMTEAVTKAEGAAEKRFEAVNEFRSTLSDQQRTFIPRAEYEAGHTTLENTVLELKGRLDKLESMKQGGSSTIAYLAGGIGLLIGIIALSRNFLAAIYQKSKEK